MRPRLHFALLLVVLPLLAFTVNAQSNTGELRLKITGPNAQPIKASIDLSSDATQFHRSFYADDSGLAIVRNLPFGLYRLKVHEEDFAPYDGLIEIHSALPAEYIIKLSIAALSTAVNVTADETLLDPERTTTINHLDSKAIAERPASFPGRSLPDLINSQPGWLYEGNAVLHPRGSEYQTQFVVDGIPLTDNRSPGSGPELEADEVDSLTIYTAGIPAEYGRKMGGVVEVNTLHDAQSGLHGQAVFSGGSFDTAGAFASLQDSWRHNTLGASAAGNMTARYLNPVVPENYTNRGTTGDFSLSYERDLTPKDRLTLMVRHELARYEIPNEQPQQFPDLRTPPTTAPQLQTADNFETIGIASYQHIFSSNILANIRGMVRNNSDDLNSNSGSWPIAAFQHNNFNEGYFNSTISIHYGRQEWKAGLESDNLFLHENFSDLITANPGDPLYPFDPSTPSSFAFAGSRPDLEQSAFVQDLVRLGKWTVNAGLRWDHYQLIVNQNAVSPRFSVARYFPSANLIFHASYDRIFQTPAFENILLASSPVVLSLNPNVLRLPVQPSHGNYFEIGATKSFLSEFRLDANYFRRYVNNFADDDQILNTAVSFPIAFRKAIIYGAEAKLELPHWNRFSGFLSYSYQVGNAWFPVTGGLFVGSDAVSATTQLTGHFPDSQDQRNTIRARVRYQLISRLWIAGGAEYGSGLPFEYTGTYDQALAEYGAQMVNRINFADGRTKSTLSIDASSGLDLYKKEKRSLRLQADVENLNNRLNVIDFGGLFSGNAIAPPRSYALRLAATF
ncbi:MAG TPA: TonB-dependent receptor [Candidatus Sulfotelmatobacter sp.]|nr:TonB-dependent receptor [Candidatus Sulfotelmatobacter sp.]